MHGNLQSELEEIGRMLNSMMEKSDSFCGSPPTAKSMNPQPDYFYLLNRP